MVGERQWRALGWRPLVSTSRWWSSGALDAVPNGYAEISDWLVGATHGGWSATRDPARRLTRRRSRTLALIASGCGAGLRCRPLARGAYWLRELVRPLRSPAGLRSCIGAKPDRIGVPWAILAYAASPSRRCYRRRDCRTVAAPAWEALRWLRRGAIDVLSASRRGRFPAARRPARLSCTHGITDSRRRRRAAHPGGHSRLPGARKLRSARSSRRGGRPGAGANARAWTCSCST